MRCLTAVLGGAAVVLMAAGLVAQAKPSVVDQAKPSFAGEWKMMADQGAARGEGGSGPDLMIAQSGTAMTLEYRAGGQLTYRLDGSVSRNATAGRGGAPTEQLSTAMWAGNKIVVTTTTGAGEERRTFSTDGAYLLVETSAPARNGAAPNVTKVTYKRYERGFGG